jgi:tight adherence protein B
MLLAILLGLVVALVLFVAAVHQLTTNATVQREAAASLRDLESGGVQESRLDRWDRRFRRTRAGRAIERELHLAGIAYRPLVVGVAAAAASLAIPYVLWKTLAPVFGVVGVAGGWLLLRLWIKRAKDRRREAFVQQIPDLARVLSNATSAGLSITTAWAVAAEEMSEPARTEVERITNAVKFGAPLERAMLDVVDRLPSREVRVLMSTLVVSARSGGSLVKALRDISVTLDDRKEVRREIRTTLAQSVATGYMVIAMGIGLLFLLNTVQPGTVQKLTTNIIGQAALVVSFALFAVGFLAIRRMTRVDL